MKNSHIYIAAFVALALAAGVGFMFMSTSFEKQMHDAYTSAENKAQASAQKVIDHCWAISEEDRGGDNSTTVSMREGSLNSALCMEEHILKLSRTVLFKKSPESQKEVKDSLQKIHDGTGRLYWVLYNENDSCPGWCGTANHPMHNAATAHIMEEILRDFYSKIGEIEADRAQADQDN